VKPIDFAKAAGVAAAVLVVDVLLAIAVVYVWSIFVEPGHERAFYESAGIPLARVCTRIFGTALIFAASGWAARRHPGRNAIAFAVAVVFCYAFLDGASIFFQDFFSIGVGITMLIKLIAGVAGAILAQSLRRETTYAPAP
jgi:hypothetical protein